MAKWSRKTSTVMLTNTITVVIAMACFLTGNDNLIMAFSIMYGVFMFFAYVGLTACLVNPAKVAMQMGVVIDEDGKRTINPEKWDRYIELYRNRLKSSSFWLSNFISAVLITVFWVKEAYILFSIAAIAVILGEISIRLIHKIIKAKKTGWGAASYIIALQDAFGPLVEEKEKEV